MPITLGTVTFDEANTAVKETLEEVGGRNERRIIISGLVTGFSDVASIESRLDDILDAASKQFYTAKLSLRPGRTMFVRRENFRREVRSDALTGAFTLELGARDPFEESEAVSSLLWPISASGAVLAVASAGNLDTPATVTLVAAGELLDPAISDGERTIAYSGMVGVGDMLIFDGTFGHITLNGNDVTPYTSGMFPRVSPEGTTLTFTDDVESTHSAAATVLFQDRWW